MEFSLACDLIRPVGASAETWSTVAFMTMVGGLIGALGAALSGAIESRYYTGGAPPVKKIALTFMAINLTAVALPSIVCVALISVSSWLGGQMVHVYGVGAKVRE